MTVEKIFMPFGFQQTAVKKAAGIFLKRSDINNPLGRIVGFIADFMIAAGLGVTCVYWLTLTGKDRYLIKGAGLGAAEWSSIYGVLSRLGATSIFPTKPLDALVAFLSHIVFGVVKITIVVKMGDDRLFKPKNLTKDIKNPQELI